MELSHFPHFFKIWIVFGIHFQFPFLLCIAFQNYNKFTFAFHSWFPVRAINVLLNCSFHICTVFCLILKLTIFIVRFSAQGRRDKQIRMSSTETAILKLQPVKETITAGSGGYHSNSCWATDMSLSRETGPPHEMVLHRKHLQLECIQYL